MGIHKFSAAFEADGEVHLEDLKGKTIAIDAFSEMYRMALGIKSQQTMTDGNGNSTAHLNSLVAFVIKWHRHGIQQIWVFDHISADATASVADLAPEKAIERERRRATKLQAVMRQDALFVDAATLAEINGVERNVDALSDEKKDMYHRLEKRTWSPSELVLNDFFLVLNSFNIRYIVAPPGFEGEAVCSWLTKSGLADAVYSGDTDPIAFGATEMLRYETQTRRIMRYTAANILRQIGEKIGRPATVDDIRRAAVHLGCDFAEKTPGAGPMTVFRKKNWEAELSETQLHAIGHFSKMPAADDVVIHNKDKKQFVNDSRGVLQEWLSNTKGFSADRIDKAWFSKIDTPLIVKKSKPKTTVLKKVAPKKVSKKNSSDISVGLKRGAVPFAKKKTTKMTAADADIAALVADDTDGQPADNGPPSKDASVKMSATEVSLNFDDIGALVADDADADI